MSIVRRVVFTMTLMAPASVFAQAPIGPSQPAAALAGMKLACFSPQRAFAESVQGQAALARLTALRNQKAREIDEKNQALQTQEQALSQSTALLSEAARTQRSKEVETFRVNVQRFIQDAQSEMLGVQRDLEGAFLVKLKPALAEVVKKNDLALVISLDEPAILWADPALDITGEVVKQLARLESPAGR
jgi:Skp family chaperone for outer membrane proteins